MRCARAVQKVGYCGHIFSDGQGDRSEHCVAIHRTTQILTQSKNSIMGKNKLCFTLKSRLLSVFYLHLVFLPCGRMLSQRWVVFRVVTGKLMYYWALCASKLIDQQDPPQNEQREFCGLRTWCRGVGRWGVNEG